MIRVYPKDALGVFESDGLDSRYHFSFGKYHASHRMGFGPLRVINDDLIRAGRGFDLHPHRDMEIITYVRTGAVHHRDSLGNQGRTGAGDVQVMSAGTGIAHAEYADPNEDTTLFQIWIKPDAKGLPPRWEQAVLPRAPRESDLQILVSGRKADQRPGVLRIHQDAAIYGGALLQGRALIHDVRGPTGVYVVVSSGEIALNAADLKAGDGAEVTGEPKLTIRGLTDAELLAIEV
ncbi:MAG: pirin family protein [Micavibrio aeruginosavorus]|uniref:Pirin family protein n=1 Tax=Micavibrio aeruginosavorus TaxID=349221 RepID=A0A7T5UI64_9BACT|nr:MAG: pirin family protein [Micavibrio aeruginosavorus]